MFGRLRRWWRRAGRNGIPARVVVYTRVGCHLCDTAIREIESAGQRYPLSVAVADVDAEAATAERFGDCVPVVVVNGKVRFRGRVAPPLLDRLLRAETR
jgi:hypothetical protein